MWTSRPVRSESLPAEATDRFPLESGCRHERMTFHCEKPFGNPGKPGGDHSWSARSSGGMFEEPPSISRNLHPPSVPKQSKSLTVFWLPARRSDSARRRLAPEVSLDNASPRPLAAHSVTRFGSDRRDHEGPSPSAPGRRAACGLGPTRSALHRYLLMPCQTSDLQHAGALRLLHSHKLPPTALSARDVRCNHHLESKCCTKDG